jgi:hypothetical protein
MDAHERLSELCSSFRTNQNRIESFTARSITSGLAARVARQLIKIPVVVHVVSKRAEEDISDSQIKSRNLWVCNLGGGLLGYAQFPGWSSRRAERRSS